MQHWSPWTGRFYIVDLSFCKKTLAFIFQCPDASDESVRKNGILFTKLL